MARSGPFTIRWFTTKSVVGALLAMALLSGASAALAPAADAAGGPAVISGAKAGPVSIPATIKTVAQLSLPTGGWFVTAKAILVAVGGSDASHLGVNCRLDVGSRSDQISAVPTRADRGGSRVPVLMTMAGRLTSPGQARLRCVGESAGDVKIRDIRLSALKAGTLTTRESVSPAKTSGSGSPRMISAKFKGGTAVAGDLAFHDVGVLEIPAGRWWVIAKAVESNGNTNDSYYCRLFVGGDFDLLRTSLSAPGFAGDTMPLGLQVVHDFASPGAAVLACKGPWAFDISKVVITAVKAGKLTNQNLDGGPAWTAGVGTPRIISGWSDGPRDVPQSSKYVTIRELTLPPGRWSVLAKLWFVGVGVPSDVTPRRALCRLEFGSDLDASQVQYANNVSRIAPTYLSLVHRSSSTSSVQLQCRRTASGGTGEAHFIKITALKTG